MSDRNVSWTTNISAMNNDATQSPDFSRGVKECFTKMRRSISIVGLNVIKASHSKCRIDGVGSPTCGNLNIAVSCLADTCVSKWLQITGSERASRGLRKPRQESPGFSHGEVQ